MQHKHSGVGINLGDCAITGMSRRFAWLRVGEGVLCMCGAQDCADSWAEAWRNTALILLLPSPPLLLLLLLQMRLFSGWWTTLTRFCVPHKPWELNRRRCRTSLLKSDTGCACREWPICMPSCGQPWLAVCCCWVHCCTCCGAGGGGGCCALRSWQWVGWTLL